MEEGEGWSYESGGGEGGGVVQVDDAYFEGRTTSIFFFLFLETTKDEWNQAF